MSSVTLALGAEIRGRAGEFDLLTTLEGTMREIKPFRIGGAIGGAIGGCDSTIVKAVLAGTNWVSCSPGRTAGAPTSSHAMYSALTTSACITSFSTAGSFSSSIHQQDAGSPARVGVGSPSSTRVRPCFDAPRRSHSLPKWKMGLV